MDHTLRRLPRRHLCAQALLLGAQAGGEIGAEVVGGLLLGAAGLGWLAGRGHREH